MPGRSARQDLLRFLTISNPAPAVMVVCSGTGVVSLMLSGAGDGGLAQNHRWCCVCDDDVHSDVVDDPAWRNFTLSRDNLSLQVDLPVGRMRWRWTLGTPVWINHTLLVFVFDFHKLYLRNLLMATQVHQSHHQKRPFYSLWPLWCALKAPKRPQSSFQSLLNRRGGCFFCVYGPYIEGISAGKSEISMWNFDISISVWIGNISVWSTKMSVWKSDTSVWNS